MNEKNDYIIYKREKFQKHKLKKLFPEHYKEELTEYEIMKLAKYDRVWDTGKKKFTYSINA
jgi:hypothetical protein